MLRKPAPWNLVSLRGQRGKNSKADVPHVPPFVTEPVIVFLHNFLHIFFRSLFLCVSASKKRVLHFPKILSLPPPPPPPRPVFLSVCPCPGSIERFLCSAQLKDHRDRVTGLLCVWMPCDGLKAVTETLRVNGGRGGSVSVATPEWQPLQQYRRDKTPNQGRIKKKGKEKRKGCSWKSQDRLQNKSMARDAVAGAKTAPSKRTKWQQSRSLLPASAICSCCSFFFFLKKKQTCTWLLNCPSLPPNCIQATFSLPHFDTAIKSSPWLKPPWSANNPSGRSSPRKEGNRVVFNRLTDRPWCP